MIDEHYVYINSLVNKIKEENNEALHELYFFYKPLILSAIRRCCSKEKLLFSYRDDLNNESIFVLRSLVEKYDPDLSYFSYYLSNWKPWLFSSNHLHFYNSTAKVWNHDIVHHLHFSTMQLLVKVCFNKFIVGINLKIL